MQSDAELLSIASASLRSLHKLLQGLKFACLDPPCLPAVLAITIMLFLRHHVRLPSVVDLLEPLRKPSYTGKDVTKLESIGP